MSARTTLALAAVMAASMAISAVESDALGPNITQESGEEPGTTDVPFDAECHRACARRGGSFCGTDDQCHLLSCDTRYQYVRNFSGYLERDARELVCEDIPVTEPLSDEVFYSGVAFRCRSLSSASARLGFTRKCTATTETLGGKYTEFTCFEMAADTDFGPFLAEAADLQRNLECTDERYNETGYPKFSYRVVYETQRAPDSTELVVLNSVYNSTSEFDHVRASATLYSVHTTMETQTPTAGPTTTQATPTPTLRPSPSTSGSLSYSKKGMGISVTTAALFLMSWCYS